MAAVVVGEGLVYKPPTPAGSHHHHHHNSAPVSSATGQTVTTTSCDTPVTSFGINLTHDSGLKRKKTNYNSVTPMSLSTTTDVPFTAGTNPSNSECSVTGSSSIKRICTGDEHHSQPEVLDLTVTSTAESSASDTSHACSSSCADVLTTPCITMSSQPVPSSGGGGTFPLFPTASCSTSSITSGFDPSGSNNSIPSGLYQLPVHPGCFVTPQMLQDAACLVQLQQQQQQQQAQPTLELQQPMVTTLGMFGTAAFAAPFPMTPGTTPSSLMGSAQPPVTSVPISSAGNTVLYGNPFSTGLFPPNPFQWSTPPQQLLSLPPPPPPAAVVPQLNTTNAVPTTSAVNQSSPFPLSTWNPSLLMPPLGDPTILMMNGCVPNGATEEVKPDLLVQDLLAWSQAVAQFHQQQQQNLQIISDGTRQLPVGNSSTNQGNNSETSEGLTTSPGDDLNQSEFFDCQIGESSSFKFTNPIRKFASFEECNSIKCQSTGVREHYHCQSCEKVIIRREEMIRHAKWHRKREESLQYGFMRYSPSDDCAVSGCAHNGRQTHYHCLQANCTKVYISTSDVQMHANFHRKDAVIIQEGFQRFRASESCGAQACPFYQERTTHFHCRRPNCRFTFKNKADMEKHKLHHQKNDNFAKDGFRKYIKCETCGFASCKYSGIINHIHCIRPGCDYVVHSSSQILSHKRKHDRRFSHLTSSPSPSNPQLLSDLSNLTFDFSLPQFSGPVGGPRPRSTYSPYDLSPTADSDEPLDMKCSTGLSDRIRKRSNDQEEEEETLSTQLTSSGENSPVARDLSTDHEDRETRAANHVSSDTDVLFARASSLWRKCLRTRRTSSLPVATDDQSPLSLGIGQPNLCFLFDHVSTVKDEDEDENGESWRIEGEQNPDSSDEQPVQSADSSDLQVGRILKLIKCFSQTGVPSPVDRCDGVKAQTFRCNWPQCPSEGIRDARLSCTGITEEEDDDSDDRDAADGSPPELNDTGTGPCPYEKLHIWHMAVLQCGLLPCSGSDGRRRCAVSPTDSSHRHCYFWPSCQYTTKTDEPNWLEPLDHLSGHDIRLVTVPASWRCSPTGGRDTDLTEDCAVTSDSQRKTESSPTDEIGTPTDAQPRRRGRPPKYTKYIRVPRLHVPEELCADDLTVRELTRSMFFTDAVGPQDKEEQFAHIVCGVKLYLTNEQCPDNLCDYSIQRVEHYHCVRPRCFMASESLNLINVHRREFHSHIRISPGFEHFDRSVDCRRPTCHSKRMSQHYHCTYPNCDYAFIRPSTMIQHARKHEEVARARRLGLGHHGLQTNMYHHVGANKLALRQTGIHNSHHRHHYQQEQEQQPRAQMDTIPPPFLPLGLSPLVAAQLPAIFPAASGTLGATTELPVDCSAKSIDFVTVNSANSIAAQQQQQQQKTSLPGFLPIWAAAMAAAAAAVSKQTNGWPAIGSSIDMKPAEQGPACLANLDNSGGAIQTEISSGIALTKPERVEETHVSEV